MTQEINLSDEEIVNRIKRANAQGFMNQMIAGSGANAEQAYALYKKSDEKAVKLAAKAEQIRESILSEVKSNEPTEAKEASKDSGLAENLKKALS